MGTSTKNGFAFLAPPLRADDLGTLGSYRVLDLLGRGGMGFVFRAEDTRLKRPVALKVMNEKIAATPNSRRRFIEEARSMAAVKHDNVATIYEVNEINGTLFMAMDLLTGGTLESLTKRDEPFGYHQVIHYGIEMARGLQAAHSQGIIHRDIKPANIWIEDKLDRVKILDFGLALAQVPVDQLAGRGSVIGTPQYLSPEQARSEALDNRTDLYSLGVVLYEMCTGKLPFLARTVPEQLILTLIRKPPLVSDVNPKIPAPLAMLIASLVEKEAWDRPASAAVLEQLFAKAAVECEAKSDVALTINKLQEQLNRVNEKKTDSSTVEIVEAIPVEVYADPLASVPPVVAGGQLRSAARPTAAVATRTFGRPKPVANPGGFQLPSYWPWIAAGLTVLLFLVIVQFVFISSTGTPYAKNTVIVPDSESNYQPNAPTPPAPAVKPVPAQTPAPGFAPQPADSPAKQATPKKKPPGKKSNAGSSKPVADPIVPVETESAGDLSTYAAKPSIEIAGDELAPPETEPDFTPPSESETQTPIIERVSRLTGDGNGADATVKRGGSGQEQLGVANTLVIQTRASAEIQHSYLRFDLKGVEKRLANVAGAELTLTIRSGRLPAGAVIRVYGVPEKYPDNWFESGPRSLRWSNSLSDAGLDTIPLIAEVTFQGDEPEGSVVIKDERMAEFLRELKEPVVTLVLAGGTPDNKPIHFVSREGDSEHAPRLDLDLLPEKNKR